jgi:hypothetical protein
MGAGKRDCKSDNLAGWEIGERATWFQIISHNFRNFRFPIERSAKIEYSWQFGSEMQSNTPGNLNTNSVTV